jgi:hypothetical protein
MELVETLLLERRVANREHLVDQEDIGIDLDHHREREPHVHAGGVVLQLQLRELLELREFDDPVHALPRLARRQAQHQRVQDHVVARRQVRVEADPQLDERGYTPVDVDPAGVRAVDAGKALEQRALPGAVAAHDSEELAGPNRE